ELHNAEVVYNPCKLRGEAVPPFPNHDKNLSIAMVGRLECYHKGYDLLLQVLSMEKWKARELVFNVYGDGPHLQLLKQSANTLRLGNLHFHRHVKNVTNIWAQNHLLLMTSRIEGQALSLIEAMWCNRAAVVTAVGGATELVTEGSNGFVAESATVSSIDAALE